MFKGLLSGVKAIFGSSSDGTSNVMKAASGVGSWIDEQKFTDQEKATFNAELLTHYGKFIESTVDENSQRSLTRRDIAIWIIRFEIALLATSAATYKFDHSLAEYLFKLATTTPMDYLVLGVGAFFFGAHIVRTYQAGK